VIAYNWGVLPELIQDGETGFLVNYRDVGALTARVKELCENPNVILEMGQRGRAFVSRHYSPRVLAKRLKDVYSHILGAERSVSTGPVDICNVELLRSAPRTAIIIAVYNAYDQLRQCIASVLAHTNLTENRLIVIDDASTDARIPKFLKELTYLEYIRNEQNMGYTRTCNKGISMASSCDVVLLNSDTIVTPRWLESLRIAAYSAPAVGTATALSDNAGAFSVPVPNLQNAKPDGIGHADYARLMRHFCGGCAIPCVPTGNGFCLFIKRKLIAQIGSFDEEAFPRGYGEENDFCMRALNTGWRNVIAPAAFVFHYRNASFQREKDRLFAAGIEVVTKRYPDYAQRVKDAFSHLSMENLRGSAQRAAAATAVTTSVETRVAVCTRASVASQVQCGNGERRFVVVCSPDQIVLPKRDFMVGDGEVRISLTEDCVKEFGNWLLRCGIDRVEVEFSDNHPFDPTEVCRLFGIPILSRAATNPGKKEEDTKPSATTTPASSYLLQQATVGP
jgi:GT2 family glycosyltransferase